MKLFVVERFGTRPTAVACMAVALIASVLAFAGGGGRIGPGTRPDK